MEELVCITEERKREDIAVVDLRDIAVVVHVVEDLVAEVLAVEVLVVEEPVVNYLNKLFINTIINNL